MIGGIQAVLLGEREVHMILEIILNLPRPVCLTILVNAR